MFLAILVYVTLDLALPAMPGAFVFDPSQCVETANGTRDDVPEADVGIALPCNGTRIEDPDTDVRRMISTRTPARICQVRPPSLLRSALDLSAPVEDAH